MELLIGCFVIAMLYLMLCAVFQPDDKVWVNWLADDSKRRKPKPRRKYCKSGM